MALFGPYLVACALLVVAGTLKVLSPRPTARTLGQVLRGDLVGAATSEQPHRWQLATAELLGVSEIALGIGAAVFPRSISAAMVALAYLAFSIYLMAVRRAGGFLASCSCFSSIGARPTYTRLVVDLGLCASAGTVAAAQPAGTLFSILGRQPLSGVPLIASCAVCVWLVICALVSLPRLAEARRPLELAQDEGTRRTS